MHSSDHGRFNYDLGRIAGPDPLKFADALKLIYHPGDQCHYIQQLALKKDLPDLLADVQTPRLIDEDRVLIANLWFGTAGNVTPLHYDLANTFLCQVEGRKHVVIFGPAQTEMLYPFPISADMPHVSRVDVEVL